MYKDFYGFREYPFNITADSRFLFLSHRHQEALSHLLYGIKERKGFVMITGEIGTGKTTLCRYLMNQLDPSVRTAFVWQTNLSAGQLLLAIAHDLGIPHVHKDRLSLIEAIYQFLLDQASHERNCVIILDEAQHLGLSQLEQIRLLSNLETEQDKLIQIILVGQPELGGKLERPELTQLRQRIAVRYHITPLNREELTHYIHHRMEQAGGDGRALFSPTALDHVYQYSGGVPRLINVVCDRALLSGFVQEAAQIDETLVDRAIAEIEGRTPHECHS